MTVKELYDKCYADGSEEYEIAIANPNPYMADDGWMPEENDVEIDDRMKEVVLH